MQKMSWKSLWVLQRKGRNENKDGRKTEIFEKRKFSEEGFLSMIERKAMTN